MNRRLVLFLLFSANLISCQSQTTAVKPKSMNDAADKFLQTLSTRQRAKAQFSFTDDERYNWHFVPKTRQGIPLKELNTAQREAAFNMLSFALGDTGYKKATSIVQHEDILREVEGRSAGDDYRDSEKYFFSVFGEPAKDSIWGWRFEGHHISLNFSSQNNRLVAGTPGFMGSNPAVVLSGAEKGKQILKDETELGFALLNSLNDSQKKITIINEKAPADIITSNDRKAMINDPKGILYNELNSSQQKAFMQLLSIYIHRYAKLFAATMMKEIETAGLSNLRFAWAGDQQPGVGHPHYYRIQGPTIIIEYDNTQNNANHVHTVIRDLKVDFGGDELLQHYNTTRH